MMSAAALLLGLGSVAAGTIEVSSSDLSSGASKAYANIKGSWSQGVKLFGRSATVSAEYDRNEKENFLSEAKLCGALNKVKYELSSKFGNSLGLNLETKTDDGTTFELESEVEDLHMKVTKVSASRATAMRGQDYDLQLSHELDSNESKLKLSSVLGSGVKAIGMLSTKGKDSSMSYELEYDTQLTSGRTLSANVKPQQGTGEIEYTDSATIDGTIVANIPLGGKPTVSVKRSFSF